LDSCIIHGLPESERRLVETVRELAPVLGSRAAQYDVDNISQAEDFADLHKAGLLDLTIPKAFGGKGLNYWETPNQLGRWALIKELAKVDVALARNWESHINTTEILALVGNEEQQRDVFSRVIENGAVMSNWGTDVPKPGAEWKPYTLGQTIASPADDGWMLKGTKRYANTARLASPALVWALREGAPDINTGLMVFILETSERAGFQIDTSWWDAMGMRASDAQVVELDNLFIPHEKLAGEPGDILRVPLFGIRHLPSYSSSFVGVAEAMLEFTLSYTRERNKHKDPHIQFRVGEMRAAVETANAWMAQLAQTWLHGTESQIRDASLLYRRVTEKCVMEVAASAAKACGSTAFQRKYPFERMFRDINVYILHGEGDSLVANIGAQTLGDEHDTFWTPAPRDTEVAK
jgi:alkylation response protein AidB-like acyl-CoA dehydrogenase